jgi:hypothetical protein
MRNYGYIQGYFYKGADASVLTRLKKAKDLSDQRRYDEKTAILRELLKERPDEFEEDSQEGGIVGLTHIPTGFRIHMPAQARVLKTAGLDLDIEVGDVVLSGRYKNKRNVVEDLGTDDLGQPTVNGMKLLAVRLEKKLPDNKKSKETLRLEKESAVGESSAARMLESGYKKSTQAAKDAAGDLAKGYKSEGDWARRRGYLQAAPTVAVGMAKSIPKKHPAIMGGRVFRLLLNRIHKLSEQKGAPKMAMKR